jgi:hypothetical protein
MMYKTQASFAATTATIYIWGSESNHDHQTASTNIDSFSFDLLVIFNEGRDVLLMAAMANVKGLLGPGM